MTSDDLLAESRRMLRQTVDELAALLGEPPASNTEDLAVRLLALASHSGPERAVAADAILRGRVVAMPVLGGHLFIDLGEWTSWVVLKAHGWEVAIGQLFARMLRPGDTAIDVGAHIGGHTLALAAAVGSEGEVVACEPLPANIALLERTITANALGSIVQVVSHAIGAEPGHARLFRYQADGAGRYPGPSTMLHSLVPVRDYASDGIDVAVETLDAVVANTRAGTCQLVKIDVEGAELHVLRGATRLLEAAPRLALVVEVHPTELAAQGASVDDVIALLRAHRFALFHLAREGNQLVPRPLFGNQLRGDHLIARRE